MSFCVADELNDKYGYHNEHIVMVCDKCKDIIAIYSEEIHSAHFGYPRSERYHLCKTCSDKLEKENDRRRKLQEE